jgi:hypothetical protein
MNGTDRLTSTSKDFYMGLPLLCLTLQKHFANAAAGPGEDYNFTADI